MPDFENWDVHWGPAAEGLKDLGSNKCPQKWCFIKTASHYGAFWCVGQCVREADMGVVSYLRPVQCALTAHHNCCADLLLCTASAGARSALPHFCSLARCCSSSGSGAYLPGSRSRAFAAAVRGVGRGRLARVFLTALIGRTGPCGCWWVTSALLSSAKISAHPV